LTLDAEITVVISRLMERYNSKDKEPVIIYALKNARPQLKSKKYTVRD